VTSTLSRRSFLLGAATAIGAAACSANRASNASGSGSVISVGSPADVKDQLNLLETTDPSQLVSGVDQRIAFVLQGAQAFVTPDSPVTLQFGPGLSPAHLGPPIPGVAHTDSSPAPAYVTTTYRFPAPGDYWVRATYKGRTADAPLQGITTPSDALVPLPGKPMISTPTPTFTDTLGLKLLCTRQPQCPWHDASLDAVLTRRRPVALLFATPALCQTATCGPVLNTLLALKAQFEGEVHFLHSEIYTDMTAAHNVPAVLAYHLTSEPVLFVAGADGIVRTRIDGLFGRGEAAAALSQL
jgi:hypothetical protein